MCQIGAVKLTSSIHSEAVGKSVMGCDKEGVILDAIRHAILHVAWVVLTFSVSYRLNIKVPQKTQNTVLTLALRDEELPLILNQLDDKDK